MYGMVNRALQNMIIDEAGDAGWGSVCRRAGMEPPVFVSMDTYDDAITYALVGAASTELERDAGELLHALGLYWIRVTAAESYESIFHMHGSSLRGFLENLDQMHARLSLHFPEMRAPSFEVEDAEHGMHVRYWSDRPGLAPFVKGLLAGLCERFGEPYAVRHVGGRDDGRDHELFHLEPTA